MKHCPNQECTHLVRVERIAEFKDEAEACSDCGGALVVGEAPPSLEPAFRALVTVYEAPDPIRGHLLRTILEDREIPAVVVGDDLTGAIGELPATVLQVRVQVEPEHASAAAAIAIAFDRGDFDA